MQIFYFIISPWYWEYQWLSHCVLQCVDTRYGKQRYNWLQESNLYLQNWQIQKFPFSYPPWEQLKINLSPPHLAQSYFFSKHTIWPATLLANSPSWFRYHFDSLIILFHFIPTTTSSVFGSSLLSSNWVSPTVF